MTDLAKFRELFKESNIKYEEIFDGEATSLLIDDSHMLNIMYGETVLIRFDYDGKFKYFSPTGS